MCYSWNHTARGKADFTETDYFAIPINESDNFCNSKDTIYVNMRKEEKKPQKNPTKKQTIGYIKVL